MSKKFWVRAGRIYYDIGGREVVQEMEGSPEFPIPSEPMSFHYAPNITNVRNITPLSMMELMSSWLAFLANRGMTTEENTRNFSYNMDFVFAVLRWGENEGGMIRFEILEITD